MMSRRSNAASCLHLSLSTVADLDDAELTLQESSTGEADDYQVLCMTVSDPRLLRHHSAQLQNLLVQSQPDLQEIRLAIRGVGKQLGRQHHNDDDEAEATEDEGNTVAANAVADLLSSLPSATTKVSLELSVSKLEGSLERLCLAVSTGSLYRVVLHECHSDEPRGILPLVDALAQHCHSLQALTLDAVTFPVGDITAQVLARLVTGRTTLTRLELNKCVNLGDEELLPLVQRLSSSPTTDAQQQQPLEYLKLSTGLSLLQPHPGLQWGAPVVQAVAAALRDPACAIQHLHMTHTNTQANSNAAAVVSLLPIVQAMAFNRSVTRLHLYDSSNSKTSLASAMVRILRTNQNMTLRQCNSLGGGCNRDDFAALAFYTRLNQLDRGSLLKGLQANDQDKAGRVISTLLEQSRDHRIVHYILSNCPSLCC